MAKELNEETGFKVSLKTLGGIGFVMVTVIGMWFSLQADIEEAKELPEPLPPDVTRMEFDMKDQLIRQTIMTTQEDVEEIKDELCHSNRLDTSCPTNNNNNLNITKVLLLRTNLFRSSNNSQFSAQLGNLQLDKCHKVNHLLTLDQS